MLKGKLGEFIEKVSASCIPYIAMGRNYVKGDGIVAAFPDALGTKGLTVYKNTHHLSWVGLGAQKNAVLEHFAQFSPFGGIGRHGIPRQVTFHTLYKKHLLGLYDAFLSCSLSMQPRNISLPEVISAGSLQVHMVYDPEENITHAWLAVELSGERSAAKALIKQPPSLASGANRA